VTDTQSGEVGTLFINTEFAQSSGSLVSNASHQVINSWNSIISGSVQLGNIWQGIFIASHLGRIDRPIEVIRGGTARTLL
jgi:Na+-transporting NADH:ubiquinone oxidoreductase subunit NqrA